MVKDFIKELLCFHLWNCIHVQHITRFDYYENNVQSTHATMMCKKCNKISVRYLTGAGHLTQNQINGIIYFKETGEII